MPDLVRAPGMLAEAELMEGSSMSIVPRRPRPRSLVITALLAVGTLCWLGAAASRAAGAAPFLWGVNGHPLVAYPGIPAEAQLDLVADLGDIVTGLPVRPRMIILNKVGVVERKGYFTLESYGTGRMPYRIFSRDELGHCLRGLGYRKLTGWMIPERNFSVPSQFGADLVMEIGEAWEDMNLA